MTTSRTDSTQSTRATDQDVTGTPWQTSGAIAAVPPQAGWATGAHGTDTVGGAE